MDRNGQRRPPRRRGRAWLGCLGLAAAWLAMPASAADESVAPASGMLDVVQAVELHRAGVAEATRQIDATRARGLERSLGGPATASDAELEMRAGFYYLSLVDRLGERAQADTASRCATMAGAIAAASKY